MKLLTQNQASKLEHAPSAAGINKKLKQKKVPAFFVSQGEKMLVDVDHPEWIRLIQKRQRQAQKGLTQGLKKEHPGKAKKEKKPKKEKAKPKKNEGEKPKKNKKVTIQHEYDDTDFEGEDLEELTKAAYIANLKEQILKNDGIHFQNEIKKMALIKGAKNVISVDYANFVYFGYMEKINVELLMMTKKLSPKIEARMKEGDLKGILKLIDREHEIIIRETKKNQAEDAEKWRAEK